MKFKIGDKVKIRKNVTLEEIAKNHFNGCQLDTMNFLFDASCNNFEDNFRVVDITYHDNLILGNVNYAVNPIVLEKVENILDDKEKEYLKAVIKPFRNKIGYIVKRENLDECIRIAFTNDYDECISLPYFKRGTMYKNMKVNKEYTLKELGLDE